MELLGNPILIPVLGIVCGTAMIVAIVAMSLSHKAREHELQVRQEMQIRQFEHERRMKEMELEIAKAKVTRASAA
jgi:type II secretory pathway pseudopilin PulG